MGDAMCVNSFKSILLEGLQRYSTTMRLELSLVVSVLNGCVFEPSIIDISKDDVTLVYRLSNDISYFIVFNKRTKGKIDVCRTKDYINMHGGCHVESFEGDQSAIIGKINKFLSNKVVEMLTRYMENGGDAAVANMVYVMLIDIISGNRKVPLDMLYDVLNIMLDVNRAPIIMLEDVQALGESNHVKFQYKSDVSSDHDELWIYKVTKRYDDNDYLVYGYDYNCKVHKLCKCYTEDGRICDELNAMADAIYNNHRCKKYLDPDGLNTIVDIINDNQQ